MQGIYQKGERKLNEPNWQTLLKMQGILTRDFWVGLRVRERKSWRYQTKVLKIFVLGCEIHQLCVSHGLRSKGERRGNMSFECGDFMQLFFFPNVSWTYNRTATIAPSHSYHPTVYIDMGSYIIDVG